MNARDRLSPNATRARFWGGVVVGAFVVLAGPQPALADHSLGRSCLTCHSLRSTAVVLGTRNLLKDEINFRLYDAYWYCPSYPSVFNGISDPLDCTACHGTGGDIGGEIFKFSTSITGVGVWPATGSSHPVDVKGSTISFRAATAGPGTTIKCNDCHNTDVTPAAACNKTVLGGGYPNHLNLSSGILAAPGANQRPGHLDAAYTYGPTTDWASGALDTMLCFKCHKAGNTFGASSKVKTEYDAPSGGHNLQGVGSLAMKKLPCYDCHDAHASVDKYGNAATENRSLILNGADLVEGVWTNPQKTTKFKTSTNFVGTTTGDRMVCTGCHGASGVTTEGVVATALVPANVKFAFHANVHTEALTTGSCLQKYNGCHQSPHNTDLFRCLDCHSPYAAETSTNARLLAVAHVGDEFAATRNATTGSITLSAVPGATGLKSRHDIVYDDTADMAYSPSQTSPVTSQKGGNGCLLCHPASTPAGKVTASGSTGYPASVPTDRDGLSAAYDGFCTSCHDGGSSFGSYVAPEVNRYWATAGHGRPTSDTYPTTGNRGAATGCLECHVYHGSTAYKLLPGDAQTALFATKPSLAGRVVKGFGYSSATLGTKFKIGALTDSTLIDYTDYTDPANNSRLASDYKLKANYLANYTGAWSTYEGTNPKEPVGGTAAPFGTSGDLRDNSNSSQELACGDSVSTSFSKKVGFCNACHFYDNSTDGTQTTAGWVYTHEGNCDRTGDTNKSCTTSGSKDQRSQKNFFKDCAECHDPHGSGSSSGSGDTSANKAMVRGKVFTPKDPASDPSVTSADNWSWVTFKNFSGTADSFGYVASTSTKPICAVCHAGAVPREGSSDCTAANTLRVDFQYVRLPGGTAQAPPSHNDVQNCTTCHPHGPKKGSAGTGTDQRFVGFNRAACTGCHGLPPLAPGVTATDPENEKLENYSGGGGAHKKHVDFLKAQFTAASQTPSLDDLCSPCHGANVGSGPGTSHPDTVPASASWDWESGIAKWNLASDWGTAGKWNLAVDIVDGRGNFGSLATYGGAAEKSVLATANAKGGEPQQCKNLNCHGPGAPTRFSPTSGSFSGQVSGQSLRLLWDLTEVDTVTGRSVACAGCHAARTGTDPVTSIVVRNSSLTPLYTSALGSQGVTAGYFGTPSGYGSGGHGDSGAKKILGNDARADEAGCGWSPQTCAPPLTCDKCHVDPPSGQHFTGAAGKSHFLADATTTLEGATGLCTKECHTQMQNLGNPAVDKTHHPSDVSFTRAFLGTAGKYDVSSVGDVDGFVSYWSSPPPTYNAIGAPPHVNLPRLNKVFFGQSEKLSCVTCHNPHGTDLALDVLGAPGTNYTGFPNHMLRLRDEDKTLCDACHK